MGDRWRGGSFRNLWTPSPFAHAGMLIENTSTPGWLYQMSSEHHLRNEVILRGVRNWEFFALQFEEENWEGRHTLPLEITDSADLVFPYPRSHPGVRPTRRRTGTNDPCFRRV